ncbi:MAG: potassium channel protein [Ignavibacteria bacterium]
MDSTLGKRLLQAGGALLIILLIGTTGYFLITKGQIDIFTCLYMTVVTITTIGYEIINLEQYEGARAFTMFLAFAGIGLLTYFVSTISAIIIEGHLRESYKKRKMEKTITRLHDHYIVCGVGKHAMHIIDELIATERHCVFIEIDPVIIKEVRKKFPMQLYIEGDSTSDEVLTKAGVQNAKGLFASTMDDNLNLVISLSAKRLNPKIKIVSLCLNHSNQEKLKIAGADTIVSPNYIGGLRMASEMLRPGVTTFLDVMLRDKDKNIRIEQIDITEEHKGKTIGQLKIDDLKDTLLLGVNSNGDFLFKPQDSYEVTPGDSLIVMTSPEERIKLEDN